MTLVTHDYHAATRRFEDFLIAAIDRKRRSVIWPTRINHAKTACEFLTGPVTDEMVRHAAAISEFYYRKRIARNASLRRAA
jgi:hypothetical protein